MNENETIKTENQPPIKSKKKLHKVIITIVLIIATNLLFLPLYWLTAFAFPWGNEFSSTLLAITPLIGGCVLVSLILFFLRKKDNYYFLPFVITQAIIVLLWIIVLLCNPFISLFDGADEPNSSQQYSSKTTSEKDNEPNSSQQYSSKTTSEDEDTKILKGQAIMLNAFLKSVETDYTKLGQYQSEYENIILYQSNDLQNIALLFKSKTPNIADCVGIYPQYADAITLYRKIEHEKASENNFSLSGNERVQILDKTANGSVNLAMYDGKRCIEFPEKNLIYFITKMDYSQDDNFLQVYPNGEPPCLGDVFYDVITWLLQESDCKFTYPDRPQYVLTRSQKGIIHRESKNENSPTWRCLRDGEIFLERNAINEYDFNTSTRNNMFSSPGSYEVYVTEFSDSAYRQVSNSIKWKVD